MFVLNQYQDDFTLDKDSLKLLMNMVKAEEGRGNDYSESGLTKDQSQDIANKVVAICEKIKLQDKAEHLNLNGISIRALVSEILLAYRSKAATAEWFKDEMRELGGLDLIIKTTCECCEHVQKNIQKLY